MLDYRLQMELKSGFKIGHKFWIYLEELLGFMITMIHLS